MTGQPFQSSDADRRLLDGRRVAILGYGNQGHAHAQNLRDSGVDVVVGARPDGQAFARAEKDGFLPQSIAGATEGADIVMLLLPDEVQAEVMARDVMPHLKDDAVLAFGHGFVIAFDLVELDPQRRAFLVAPKGQGHALRAAYVAGGGLPSLLATHGPDSEGTFELALAYADACGALAGGGFASSFREEAVTDQFGEQAVLCGGLVELVTAAWQTLVDRGYSAEVAYFECLHEVKIIVDLMHAHGIDGMREKISTTAAVGGLDAGPRVIGEASRAAMGEVLDDIESGAFARHFQEVQSDGGKGLRTRLAEEAGHPIVATGRGLRDALERCRLNPPTSGDDDA